MDSLNWFQIKPKTNPSDFRVNILASGEYIKEMNKRGKLPFNNGIHLHT